MAPSNRVAPQDIPSDVLAAALSYEAEPATRPNPLRGKPPIPKPDFTDYLTQATGNNLSDKAGALLRSGGMSNVLSEIRTHPDAAQKLLAERIKAGDLKNIPLAGVRPDVMHAVTDYQVHRMSNPSAAGEFSDFMRKHHPELSLQDMQREAAKLGPGKALGDLNAAVARNPGLSATLVTHSTELSGVVRHSFAQVANKTGLFSRALLTLPLALGAMAAKAQEPGSTLGDVAKAGGLEAAGQVPTLRETMAGDTCGAWGAVAEFGVVGLAGLAGTALTANPLGGAALAASSVPLAGTVKDKVTALCRKPNTPAP